jgi:hypothetical protein
VNKRSKKEFGFIKGTPFASQGAGVGVDEEAEAEEAEDDTTLDALVDVDEDDEADSFRVTDMDGVRVTGVIEGVEVRSKSLDSEACSGKVRGTSKVAELGTREIKKENLSKQYNYLSTTITAPTCSRNLRVNMENTTSTPRNRAHGKRVNTEPAGRLQYDPTNHSFSDEVIEPTDEG